MCNKANKNNSRNQQLLGYLKLNKILHKNWKHINNNNKLIKVNRNTNIKIIIIYKVTKHKFHTILKIS